jgi:hypothetical protein
MNDPFAYPPLEEENTPLPEQYQNVTASKDQWLSQVVQLAVLERNRLGIPIDEQHFFKANAMFGDYTDIFVLDQIGVFEHQPFTIQTQEGLTFEDLQNIWKRASDEKRRIALHMIIPIYQSQIDHANGLAFVNQPNFNVVNYTILYQII